MRVYLAAPLFTQHERTSNLELCKEIETLAEVYLPQRDGVLLSIERSDADEAAVAKSIYTSDTYAISKSDVVVAVVDGPSVDDGVSFELGYAAALGKYCLSYSTDSRRAPDYFSNPMWRGCMSGPLFTDKYELLHFLRSLRAEVDS